MDKHFIRTITAIALVFAMMMNSVSVAAFASEEESMVSVQDAVEDIGTDQATDQMETGDSALSDEEPETLSEAGSEEGESGENQDEDVTSSEGMSEGDTTSNGDVPAQDVGAQSEISAEETADEQGAFDDEESPDENEIPDENATPDNDTPSISEAGEMENTSDPESAGTDGIEPETDLSAKDYTLPEITETVDTSYFEPGDQYSLFADYAEYVFFGEAASGEALQLDRCNALAYEKLKAHLSEVAEGKKYSVKIGISLDELGLADKKWTAEELGVETIIEDDAISGAAAAALYAQIGFDANNIVHALLNACPCQFFWFDQQGGVEVSGFALSASDDGAGCTLALTSGITFDFSIRTGLEVDEDEVDPSVAQDLWAAKENADAIVSKYAGKSDYDILLGYKNDICARVSSSALAGTSGNAYCRASEIVCVFDNYPATNAGYEGYAKAFQYLCNETSFSSDLISCITVTGTIGGGISQGPYMWNIIRMEDGNNYLVDLTNCDEGAIGHDSALWMIGGGNANIGATPETGYSFDLAGNAVSYSYDERTLGLYDHADLILSENDYLNSLDPLDPAEEDPSGLPTKGECGENVFWELSDGGVLRITGQGPMWNDNGSESIVGGRSLEVKRVLIEEGVTSIAEYAFYANKMLQDVVIPSSVTIIGSYAFGCCTSLDHIAIPNGVTSIGERSFWHCDTLRTVSIGKKLSTVGLDAFGNDMALESVTVNAKNKYLSSVGGVLFNKEGTKLIKYAGRDRHLYKVPDGVKEIAQYAFDMANLTVIIFPKSLTKLNGYALNSCWYLEKITFYSKLKTIDGFAFANCGSLKDVYYYGTKTNWKSIKIKSGNENLTNAKRHYLKSSATTASGKCGSSLKWTLSSKGTLTISGSGEMKYYEQGNYPWDKYKQVIKKLTIKEGLTCIPSYAFEDFANIQKLVIPDSVKTIQDFSFSNCISLSAITFGNHVKSIDGWAFAGCTSLKKVTLPDSLTRFTSSAFADCSSVTSLIFGKGLAKIVVDDGNFSVYTAGFGGMPGLKSITVPSSNTHYKTVDGVLFSKDGTTLICYPSKHGKTYTVPGTVKKINKYAFLKCSSLEQVTIPSSVMSIGKYAFSRCANLKKVTIGKNVTGIGVEAFSNCPKLVTVKGMAKVTKIPQRAFFGDIFLKNISIPEGVTTIGTEAFSGCAGLVELTLPKGVKTIGDEAFFECAGLKKVELPATLREIGRSAFGYCSHLQEIAVPKGMTVIKESAFTHCHALTNVVFPSTLKSIESYAFSDCRSLRTIDLPGSVSKIGEAGFAYCTSVTSVNISAQMTSIGTSVFEGCNSLAGIDIPESITKIGDDAFRWCGLEEVVLRPGLKSIGSGSFAGNPLTVISFPVTLKTIKAQAFADNKSLKTVIFLDNLTSVGERAFIRCDDLQEVFYYGSSAKWESVEFGSGNDAIQELVLIRNLSEYCNEYGHFWNRHYTVDKETTLAETGVKSIHCSVCDLVKEGTETEAEMPLKLLTMEEVAMQTYTGKKITPDVVVRHGDRTLIKGTDYSLTYKNNVTPGWATVTVKGRGKYTGTLNNTFLISVPAPKLTAVINEFNNVKITWKKVKGASKYRILRRVYNEKKKKWGKWEKVVDTVGGEGEKKGLGYDRNVVSTRKYRYTVECITDDGNTVVSSYDTKGLDIIFIAIPSVTSVKSPQSGQLKVTWTKSKEAAGYEIRYSPDILHNTNDTVVKISNPSTLSWTVSGLPSNTRYFVEVRQHTIINGKKYYSSWGYNYFTSIK